MSPKTKCIATIQSQCTVEKTEREEKTGREWGKERKTRNRTAVAERV